MKSHFAHLKDNGPAFLNDARLIKPGSGKRGASRATVGTLPEPIDELVGPATPAASNKQYLLVSRAGAL